ncbi:MAG: adenylate/guanylate cyclase domain-containing protein [Treponema porcinum]|uniref:adenylate/guanylate cyclase domain-containing protein n=1 Tax=Treponema porcinum TaxID=261392 RepID=UPI00235622CD|nr:adenylate/guanylate cyclase domain-containing protein [Treponema porcinum]MCI7534422.1 adenylate/guanylate cyclase domain-containing protein [Treponema porcinum]
MKNSENESESESEKKSASFFICRIVSIIILAVLFVFPFSMREMNLLQPELSSEILYPFKAFFSDSKISSLLLRISWCALYVIPFSAILILITIFLKKRHKKTVYFSLLISVTVYLVSTVASMITFANTARWFRELPPLVYAAFAVALVFHIVLIAYGIIGIKTRNQEHSEYKQLCTEETKKEKELHARAMERIQRDKERVKGDRDRTRKIKLLEKKEVKEYRQKKHRTHVKTKIKIVILLTITVILATFIFTDLRNYRMLTKQTVNNTGGNQAEQVAAIYDFSDGLSAKINAFIEGFKKTNSSSPFPCERADIITTDSTKSVFLETIDASTILPEFNVFSYTTAAGHVYKIPDAEKRITPQQAALYVDRWRNEATRKEPLFDRQNDTLKYIYPVTYTRKEGHKLVGFSVITYRREILSRPYFQAKVFIFTLSAVFLYVSIVITLFLADFIANPIIFLCGSVRKTANILSELLSGTANIDPKSLTFDEKVETKDEIKDLSIEINNIVTIVRGILPYISFHTLQNADRNNSRTRELCFLFTDIRGFTTLCEGRSPTDVINILDRYLGIETKIILANGGDVDKYVGDEMMAFFSGPDKEINACKAAMEIRKAMRKEQEKDQKEGTQPISMGIGINSGTVVFGPVGSSTRKDFTSIGDTVNLAARLEGANKEYGSKTIISEAVFEHLHNTFICRELDYITVKGKTEPVRIYEILQSAKDSTEKLYDIKKLFEAGLNAYRKKQWKTAEKYFTECNQKYDDAPSQVFLRRIIHYKISPPEKDWKGVFVMAVK